jgi:gamma-glutamyltranspeptidase/glutathione hydrolase
MSRAYRISIKESLSRHVQVDDGVCSTLELLPILSKERMRELLAAELAEKGFVREGETTKRNEGDGITTSVDLNTGEVSVTAEGHAEVNLSTERTAVVDNLLAGEREKTLRDAARQALERAAAHAPSGGGCTASTPFAAQARSRGHRYSRPRMRTVAAIGTAAGVFEYGLAVTLTLLVFFAHVLMRWLSGWIEQVVSDLQPHAETMAIFMPDGKVPRAGTTLTNPNLAQTLEAIGRDGRAGFYEGAVGKELARFAKEKGGFFTEADLKAQSARWGDALKGTYRDVTLYETPAPTQGFTVLEMLNLLEPLELHKREYLGADHAHFLVQAKQIAYHDRDRHLADPRFADVPMDRLISKKYADERRSLMDPARALPWDKVPSYGSLSGDTVFIAVVDAEGNAVSLIHSLYGVFGSAVVAGNTGVVLQNRSAYFNLDPAHPNHVEPGKTPLHTLIASMGFRDDRLWSVVGCMGADGQPQIHLQTYINLIDFGCDIQAALESPRWLSGRFGLHEPRDTLHIEARFPKATIDELERRGHILDRWGDWNEFAGHAHGIVIDPQSGMRYGGSDPRSDGAAIGY